MAPEILDGTANCSSPRMSPSVCLSTELRHGDSDKAQVAKTAGCKDPSRCLNGGVQSDKPTRETLLCFISYSVQILYLPFLYLMCINHKVKSTSWRIRWFLQLFLFFRAQNKLSAFMAIHKDKQPGISDEIWSLDSLSNTIMINLIAVIYMKTLYNVH